MNFSILGTMRPLWAPQHELSCAPWTWERLLTKLYERGRHGARESGAFLLGYRSGARARIVDFVLYDDLDPRSLDTGIVRFDGRYFGRLWEICRRRDLAVVADVHTHPGSSQQSPSDQAHPMITRAGHIALIVPRFAARAVQRADIGIYRYLGARRWETVLSSRRRTFLHIGF
jgi:proteasome lid subunit RPN8/RPN11